MTFCMLQTPNEMENTPMPKTLADRSRKNTPEARTAERPNIHPADELSAVREELKILENRADELREQLLAEGADLTGDQYTANIIPGTRETLDRKALEETFGADVVAPFLKKTHFKTVKLVEN